MTNYSIIIPNFNGAHFLSVCLSSLMTAVKSSPKNKYEFILVDNHSHDDSINIFEQFDLPQSRILKLAKNFGFASAVNKGIQSAKYEYVVVCNNDLTVESNWFDIITKSITSNQNPLVATFSGLVLNKEGTHIESEGLEFFIRGKARNINNGKIYTDKTALKTPPTLIWGASAALIVYQKNILNKIGLFDEDFFAYEEDVDLAYRLNKSGYKTLYTPSAIAYHLGGGTSRNMGNFRHRMDAKNWIYLILKNYTVNEIFSNFFSILEERLRNCSGLIKNTPFLAMPYWLIYTYSETFFHLPKIIAKRKMVN